MDEDLEISPLKPRKLRSQGARRRKSLQTADTIVKYVCEEQHETLNTETEKTAASRGERIWSHLIREYHDTEDKLKILTIACASGASAHEISTKFDASRKLTDSAVKVFNEKGVLGTRDKKKGSRSLPEDISKKVLDFFETDEISRMMPGKRDCVIVRENGQKTYLQKRLMLHTLGDAYKIFCEKNGQNSAISFSSFVKLRPKNCVFPFSPGTTNPCVCILHETPF